MPTLHTTTYTSVFSGQNVGPAFPQYNTFTISGNIELSWPMGFQNLNPVVAVNMDISATAGGFTVKMPDAEGAGTGYAIKVNNPGNFSFNLIDNASNLIVSIPNGTTKEIWLIDNSTQAGVWRTFPNPGGGAAVTSINATSSSNNLVVTGAPGLPITGAGTIQFALANDLLALSTFGASTGFSVRTAANTWILRNVNGTAGQILVTNPSGVAGDVAIALSPVLTNLVSIGVGNLSLSVNTIASTNSNGNIIINPQGIGRNQLSKNTELLTGSSLKFFDISGNFYVSFKAGTTSVNQDLIWPTTAPVAGQVLSHTALGQLAWATVPTSGGGTTILNSIARYSNTGGVLTDSNVIIDNAWNITGIHSAQINNILIGTIGAATISTQVTDQDLTFQPNGIGTSISKSDFIIRRNVAAQSRLKLYNSADNFYAGIIANPNMIASYTWQLPLAGDTAGFFYTDNTNVMSITPITSFFPVTSTLNAVARYSSTTYPLKNSLFVIDDSGAGTGLISLSVGNINISSTANTVSTISNNNLNLSPNGTGIVASTSDVSLLLASTQLKLRLYNQAGTFFTGLQAGAVVTSDKTFTLPIAFPATPGILKCSTAGVMTTDALAAAAGPLRVDSAGVITVNNLVTNDNTIPRFDGTVALFQTSTAILDDNENLNLGGSVPATSVTRGLQVRAGTSPTANITNQLSIGCKNTGTGTVLELYGGDDAGVSASVSAVVTNKISIYVKGTRYYLLASTSGV